MQRRNVLTVALVAILLVPAATAYVPTGNSAPETGESAGGAVASATDADDTNYTRLYIEDGYRHAEVKPGESTTFNITVGNEDDEAVELNPHLVLPQVQGRPIEESWVTIEDGTTTLDPEEEQTFTVTVDVPGDVELGDYRAEVAFTNQTIAYEGQPPRPVHGATISVEVWKEPAIEITGDRYHYTQIKAGDSYTYEYQIKNTGDEPVPLNPKLQTEDSRNRRSDEETVDRSWFEIEAPNEVGPGETATVRVTVSPPNTASVGDYRAEVDLGLRDPNRPERDGYWQQVDLNFQVWKQPDEPYEASFTVSDATEDVRFTLSAGDARRSSSDNPVSFDVTFVAPDGTVADHQRVGVSTRGHVSLGEHDDRGVEQGPYTSGGENHEFTYRVEDPVSGDWTVRITPHNTMDFQYRIHRNETGG